MSRLRRYSRLQIGCPSKWGAVGGNGPSTFDMTALNKGWAARFTATDSRDITAIAINWGTVTSPVANCCRVRIETTDATNGKPSGSLYDANATIDFTPSAGWQLLTFASAPTAGLTAGAEYHILIATVTGGSTSLLINSHVSGAGEYPHLGQTATDYTTRSNFADQASAGPIIALVFEDGSEESLEFCLLPNITANQIYGTRGFGVKFAVDVPVYVAGAAVLGLHRSGSPADPRVDIYNASNAIVASRTVDKDSLTGVADKKALFLFATPVLLAPGTYRAVLNNTDRASTSTNRWGIYNMSGRTAETVPQGFIFTGSANLDASPIAWDQEDTAKFPLLSLLIDDIPAPRRFRHREGVA